MWIGSKQLIDMIPESIQRSMLSVDVVEVVDSVRKLGLIMDHYLSFNDVLTKIEFRWVKLKFL